MRAYELDELGRAALERIDGLPVAGAELDDRAFVGYL
jgi:hypothetical protein